MINFLKERCVIIGIMFLLTVLLDGSLSMKKELKHETKSEFTIKVLDNDDIKLLIPFIIQERLRFYQSYPYFYVGEADLVKEDEYVMWMAKSPYTVLIVAYHNLTPIGFCWGTSLVAYVEHIEDAVSAFIKKELDFESFYYIADIIVKSEYHTSNIYQQLLTVFQERVHKLGYTKFCLAEKDDEKNDLKPFNYQSNEKMLLDNGFLKSELYSTYYWQTLQTDGSVTGQSHSLVYWMK